MIERLDPLVPQTLLILNYYNMNDFGVVKYNLPFACVSQRAAALISHNLIIPLDEEYTK